MGVNLMVNKEEHIYKVIELTQMYDLTRYTPEEIIRDRYEGGRYIKFILGYPSYGRQLISPSMTNFHILKDYYDLDEAKEFILQHKTEAITANGKFEVCKINFKEKSRYVVIREYAIIEGTIIDEKISLDRQSYIYGYLSANYVFKQIHTETIENDEELNDFVSADICSAYRIIKKDDDEIYEEYIEDLPLNRKAFNDLRSEEFDYRMGNEELDEFAYQGIRIKFGELSMIIH